MSRFYGTVRGQAKTTASRRGSEASGIVTYAASWHGAVRCEVYDNAGTDWVRVAMVPWHGAGESALLYEGPMGRYQGGDLSRLLAIDAIGVPAVSKDAAE